MGFSVNSYAKIWKVETKENYSICEISVSARNKQTNAYEKTFSGSVLFFGDAHKCRPMEGQRIKILNCDVINKAYVKPDGTKTYPIRYYIFKYELQGEENSGTVRRTATMYEVGDIEDSDVPF